MIYDGKEPIAEFAVRVRLAAGLEPQITDENFYRLLVDMMMAAGERPSRAAKARLTRSGWCESGHCGRCRHHLQAGNDRRPDLWCDCPCHPARRSEGTR